jgi:hypothetical protein
VNSFLSDGLTWLLLPLSGSANHELSFWAAWHGRIMVFCWGIVLPLGVLAARFFKVMPLQDWPAVLDLVEGAFARPERCHRAGMFRCGLDLEHSTRPDSMGVVA